jgi:N-methylhydantoinase A
MTEQVAGPLGMSVEEAAWSVYVIAAANMVRAVKAVSTYRGRNPSDFVLMAFGGNGGIYAGELMRQLQMGRAIVPLAAGVFSAVGLCVGEVQFSQSQAYLKRTSRIDGAELDSVLATLEVTVMKRLDAGQVGMTRRRSAAMRYVGQAFELTVTIPDGPLDATALADLSARFEAEHQRTYGLRLDGFATEVVSVDVSVSVGGTALPKPEPQASAGRLLGVRQVYFGPGAGWIDTPVIERGHLAGRPQIGPLIVEEYEGTTLVPPGARVSLDRRENIIIDLDAL